MLVPIYGVEGGFKTNKKPFLLDDTSFPTLENAYTFRGRLKKREGMRLIGRLQRNFTAVTVDNSGAVMTYTSLGATQQTINIFTLYMISALETNANLVLGSLIFILDDMGLNETIVTDNGDGTTTISGANPAIDSAYIDYNTGDLVANFNKAIGPLNVTLTFSYYPNLPVMGIFDREIEGVNNEQTIYFDQVYAYIYSGGSFEEFIPTVPATTWNGPDYNFFWMTNYRGSDAFARLFFVTNFFKDAGSPMRYTDGIIWTDFAPFLDNANTQQLFTARILIPYYGRLVALNTYEGATFGGSNNYFNRARFSQIGNPVQADAWESDVFGKGGFIDAPVNEEITSARFYKNTLIVFFEKTTWQLRYVGEYGLPFVWERISSDFGSESTFSTVLFDQGVLAVGDKAIISSSGNDVTRIDLDIPDTVYTFKNIDNGPERVHGVRDFKNELVYWCFAESGDETGAKFPDKSLVFNYRNNTYATFRNSVTCFGNTQMESGISWDRTDIFWDDMSVSWSDSNIQLMPFIVSGNHHGYVHSYNYPDPVFATASSVSASDQESLHVSNITRTANPSISLEIIDHNLRNEEIIYLTGAQFIDTVTITPIATDINNKFYQVIYVDKDNIDLASLQSSGFFITNFDFTPVAGTGTYIGGAQVILFPKLQILTKDFNPMGNAGENVKLSHIDFLFDSTPNSSVSVQVYANSQLSIMGNLLVGNTQVETSLTSFGNVVGATQANPCVIETQTSHSLLTGDIVTFENIEGMTNLNGNFYEITFIDDLHFSINTDSTGFPAYTTGGNIIQANNPFYIPESQYCWHRFFASCMGQFLSFLITYDNFQMTQLTTHQQQFTLNAMRILFRPGGKNIFGR